MTSKIENLFSRMVADGYYLEAQGEKLYISPALDDASELRDELRIAKPELLIFLRRRRKALLHTARQIVCCEFIGADARLLEKLQGEFSYALQSDSPPPIFKFALTAIEMEHAENRNSERK